MPEADISIGIGNSKAGIQGSEENLEACPSYPFRTASPACKVLAANCMVLQGDSWVSGLASLLVVATYNVLAIKTGDIAAIARDKMKQLAASMSARTLKSPSSSVWIGSLISLKTIQASLT